MSSTPLHAVLQDYESDFRCDSKTQIKNRTQRSFGIVDRAAVFLEAVSTSLDNLSSNLV